MASEARRFTISVTPGMEAELDAVRKKHYCDATQNEMLKDLITRGLNSLKNDDGSGQSASEKREQEDGK